MNNDKEFRPKLIRQDAFYDKLTSDRVHNRKSQTKYRWVWLIKNHDEMLWRVYVKSVFWFKSYPECKENALQQEIHVPNCAAVRLYIEIFNNGFKNVIEVLSKNDPSEEEYYTDEEEDSDDKIKYRWEWKICTPIDNIWHPYIKCDKWFDDFDTCLADGKDFNFDVQCFAAIKLCIELWQSGECILETYFDEEELYRNK